MRATGTPWERMACWSRLLHGLTALKVSPGGGLVAEATLFGLLGAAGVFLLFVLIPQSSPVAMHGVPAAEGARQAHGPGEPGHALEAIRAQSGVGVVLCLALDLAAAAALARFGGAVFRGQARGEPWACRHPLRFGPGEWQALEGLIGGSGVTEGPTPHAVWCIGERPRVYVYVLARSGEERLPLEARLRLADFLEAHSRDLPAAVDRSHLRALVVSLRWVPAPGPARLRSRLLSFGRPRDLTGLFYIWPRGRRQR